MKVNTVKQGNLLLFLDWRKYKKKQVQGKLDPFFLSPNPLLKVHASFFVMIQKTGKKLCLMSVCYCVSCYSRRTGIKDEESKQGKP